MKAADIRAGLLNDWAATSSTLARRQPTIHRQDYFFTTTISGLSFAALLWTTSALPVVLALSLRAR
jgi:hypothetical protein